MPEPTVEEVKAEVEAWVSEDWDPDISVREWWRRLAEARWTAPGFPEPWGRAWSGSLARVVGAAITGAGGIPPPGGLGLMLAAQTILAHGTPEQHEAYLPGILDGTDGWCQLFSEPSAGSDLAGLRTMAVRDGDEWVVTGQKVWTSMGQFANLGMLIARTDPDAPKHLGITYFAFPMLQDGVEVRPLREMTGRSIFNEVFLDEARVPHANVIGDLHGGWRVANTTLMVERSGIGGGAGGVSAAIPGPVAGHLDRRAGDFVGDRPALSAGGVGYRTWELLIGLADDAGRLDDPLVRQELAGLHTSIELGRLAGQRAKAGGARTGGEGNLGKIAMTQTIHQARHVGGAVLGPGVTIDGAGAPSGGVIQELTTFSPAPGIYGGTDEVQRNIIGERVLGLPKEPGPDRDTPFRELPPNG
jgi:alkylation response protein AidB-like acyl-CoA dehydrogenase